MNITARMRTLWFNAQGFEQSKHFNGLHAASAIVMSAFGQIPRIQVTAHNNDFIGFLATLDFAHYVIRLCIGQGLAILFEIEGQRWVFG